MHFHDCLYYGCDPKQETVWDPMVPSAVDRVIDESDGKTYHIMTDVYFFDNLDYPKVLLNYENPIKVFSEGKLIGWANVNLGHDRLVADIFIDYATPERLDLENHSFALYPHLMYVFHDTVVEDGSIWKMNIYNIILSLHPTEDKRIIPL